MRTTIRHLRLVPAPASHVGPPAAPGDLVLLASLLAVNLVPVLGELARAGRWGAGTVGLATAGVVLTGRELASQLRALVRRRR